MTTTFIQQNFFIVTPLDSTPSIASQSHWLLWLAFALSIVGSSLLFSLLLVERETITQLVGWCVDLAVASVGLGIVVGVLVGDILEV